MFGEATQTVGTLSADFGYAGYYVHGPSGLNLCTYRAYSPSLGRFINRDPVGENGGVNLYDYVGNMPTGLTDRSGLAGPINISGLSASDQAQIAVDGYNAMTDARTIPLSNAGSDAASRGRHNGREDALRHCIWSCILAGHFGKGLANKITDGYEADEPDSPANETAMDKANNQAGRNLAQCPGNCKDKCKKALENGGLYGLGGIPYSDLYGPAW